MGKIPPIVTVVIGVVLIIGLSVACIFTLIKPRAEELKAAQEELAKAEQEASKLERVRAENAQAVRDWLKAQADLEKLMAMRSTPISFYEPITAWVALWQEYRVTLPRAIERFIKASGLRIVSGTSIPAPPGAPPPPPSNGYMRIPESTVQVVVQGTLAQIERFYRTIGKFQRIVTISGLNLSSTGNGDLITATIPMDFYLLVEVPPTAAAPAAAPMGGPTPPGPQAGPPAPGPKAPAEEEGEAPGAKTGRKGGEGLE